MLKLSKIARASEWWEYKLPPMLAIAYATAINGGKNLFELALRLCVLLLGIIIGAAYVSIVNDFTDIIEDKACGKHNRLMNLSPQLRWILVLTPLIGGFFFTYFFLSDVLSIVIYALCWIAFSLYSIPPFRLKKKGFSGVLADASGAHLFPTLFLLSATAYYFKVQINWFWFGVTGVWSLMYGLRGILWHQFFDRDNDLKSGVATYAAKKDPDLFYKQSIVILSIEFISLAFMLTFIYKPLPVIALLVYLLMLVGYSKISKLALVAIVPGQNQPWHFVMNNYYQLLLPLSLLFTSALVCPSVWILFMAHLCLFPIITRNTIIEILFFLKAVMKRLLVITR